MEWGIGDMLFIQTHIWYAPVQHWTDLQVGQVTCSWAVGQNFTRVYCRAEDQLAGVNGGHHAALVVGWRNLAVPAQDHGVRALGF